MNEQRRSGHTVTRFTAHLVWVTKYRHPVLQGDIQHRCRELVIQICDAEDVQILKGVVSKDHVHMHIEYPPKLSMSDLVKRLKVEHRGDFRMNSLASRNAIGVDISGQQDMEVGQPVISQTRWCGNILSVIEILQIKIAVILSLNDRKGFQSLQGQPIYFQCIVVEFS